MANVSPSVAVVGGQTIGEHQALCAVYVVTVERPLFTLSLDEGVLILISVTLC